MKSTEKADWDKFDELCEIQCSIEEIILDLDISLKTLRQLVREEKDYELEAYHLRRRRAGLAKVLAGPNAPKKMRDRWKKWL